MSSSARPLRPTPAEYLVAERLSESKHEYRDGQIIKMAGASREHNLIALNLVVGIRAQIQDRPCEVYMSDIRVCVDRTGLYTYPDVVVVCGTPRFLDAETDTLLNPTVILEVLSPSTEAYDRGKKFRHYRQLPSLHEYVLISQEAPIIERFARRDEDWVITSDLIRPDGALRLDAIACAIPVRSIYERVEFPPDTEITALA